MDICSAAQWKIWFEHNRDRDLLLPRGRLYRLSALEKETISSSIQEFERGENARGKSFRIRGRLYAIRAKDAAYPRALELFIREEQRHSAYLRGFMQKQGIPCRDKVWTDGIFRKLRKLAGLDCMIVVLVTAEIIAVSYYRALRAATRSPELRAICARILRDEAAHLQFQGATLAKLRRNMPLPQRLMLEAAHAILLYLTALVVWHNHRKVFRAAHISFRRFFSKARRDFQRTIDYSRILMKTPRVLTMRPNRYAY